MIPQFYGHISGYNQIYIYEADWEKTAFITDWELYCYKVMSFVFRNVKTTYQRLVNKIFRNQIRRNMEMYVDDMLVKSNRFLALLMLAVWVIWISFVGASSCLSYCLFVGCVFLWVCLFITNKEIFRPIKQILSQTRQQIYKQPTY